MAISNLTSQYISASFQNLVQISGSGEIFNGLGNQITNLSVATISATTYSGSIDSASFASTASYSFNSISSSYAITASYALNGGSGGSGFPFTGSAIVSGSLIVTGSTNISGGITGSLFGTASWANNAITASFAATLDPTREQTTRMYKEVQAASLSSAAYTASIDLTQGMFYKVRANANDVTIHFTSSVAGYEYEFFVEQLTYSCSFEPGTGIIMYSEDNYRKANKVGSAIVAKYLSATSVALIGSLKP